MSSQPMTSSPEKQVTADELLALGADFHGELIRGRLIEMAPAGWDHGGVGGEVLILVGAFVKRHKLGKVFAAETGFILERDPDTVRAPDVAFVRAERIPASGSRRGFFDGPPDLAVEVVSPNDRRPEVGAKVAAWLAAGTLEVWVIDPADRTLTVHVRGQPASTFTAGDAFASPLALPGFTERVAAFFED